MTPHHSTQLRPRLVGLAATGSILAIVAGLPVVLVALGAGPAALALPDIDRVRAFLTGPDSGAALMVVLALLAWMAWGTLTLSLALEIAARARRTRAPRLQGLAVPQSVAHSLIGAAVLLLASAPVATAPASSAAASHLSVPAAASVLEPLQTAPTAAWSGQAARHEDPSRAVRSHIVTRGESLWSIAEAELSDGRRWSEIAALNPGRSHGRDHTLWTGTVLHLPAAPTHRDEASTYRVRTGDSLSSIAAAHLGDPDRWPEIYQASTHLVQPDGARLEDPTVIHPGWTLTLPTRDDHVPRQADPPRSLHGVEPHRSPERHPQAPTGEGSRTNLASPPPGVAAGTRAHLPEGGLGTEASSPMAPGASAAEASPPWLLAGLSGGGLLTGSLWLLLRRRRAAQARHRRPGRTLARPPAALTPVEKTLSALGPSVFPDVERLDLTLRHLASTQGTLQAPMPILAAVELGATGTTLHLEQPADLRAPWQNEGQGLHWLLPEGTPLADMGEMKDDQPAPYPLLVTVGTSDSGATWLYNLEDLTVALTGDALYATDYARYLAADIACNPWSESVRLDCLGVATEVVPMNPERLRARPLDDPHALGESIAHAVSTTDSSTATGLDTVTARGQDAGADTWPARMVLIADTTSQAHDTTVLQELLEQQAGTTGTALVLLGSHENATSCAVTIELTASGRARLPHAGLDLVAVGLTLDEAQGCAALLAAGAALDDEPLPIDRAETDGWKSVTDAAGALRPDLVSPRSQPPAEDETTMLAEDDDAYLMSGATSVDDLATLSPPVPSSTSQRVLNSDPTLDDDLDTWFADDCSLPRLTLLGPVKARTRGRALTERKAYMTSVLTYLATRAHGATPEELADTFSVSTTKARVYAGIVRDWLGTNPRTGKPHLPDARLAPSALTRGVPVYEVQDLLVDADLFRRLRARGQARGPEGITDLARALDLVSGEPFSHLRPGAWSWLYDGDRLDEHLRCAVVDVAHVVATHSLQVGDLELASRAAHIAHGAAPDEHVPLLDLAAVADARGDVRARQAFLSLVLNAGNDDAPPDLPPRSEEVLRRRGWTEPGSAAS